MAINLNQKISIEEAQKALKRSGYLLESRVETILREANYLVETNVLYDDPISGKKREIDLIAFTGSTVNGNIQQTIEIELIIECINNQQPLTFIKNAIRGEDDYIQDTYGDIRASKVTGRPQDIQIPSFIKTSVHEDWSNSLSDLASDALGSIEIKDFYTQYCSFRIKKDPKPLEWMAYHEDIHHDSFNALCSVIDQRLAESNKFYSQVNGHRDLIIHLYIPILILQNDLWVTFEQADGEIEIEEVNHVNYFRASSSIHRPVGYHIDVIRENYLKQYLDDVIAKSIKEIQNYCSNNIVEDDEGLKFQSILSKEGTK